MKKIDVQHNNLAVKNTAKKTWKKPELITIDIKNTKFNPGAGSDGTPGGGTTGTSNA